MPIRADNDIIVRSPHNPLINIHDIPGRCSDIWNAGVVRVGAEHLLLLTVESLEGRSGIYKAHSYNGTHFTVEDRPLMSPDDSPSPYESLSIRDPRITFLDDCYYVVYLAESEMGLRLAMARTQDFQSVERLGCVTQPDVKNGALFPAKFDGSYALLERPNAANSIWMSFSADLAFWGTPWVVMAPRGGYWDSDRIGAAAPPIAIEEGWLLLYYGEKITSAGPLVRLGAAVLDRQEPWKVLHRSNIPILSPREKYERVGDIPNVIFSCGALLSEDGELRVYYGASDSCICMGAVPVEEVVAICKNGRAF